MGVLGGWLRKFRKPPSWLWKSYSSCHIPVSSPDYPVQRDFYTEELYKKDLHDPDNHDGVITHLEPEILECEVKWALGSTTMNKASRGDDKEGKTPH